MSIALAVSAPVRGEEEASALLERVEQQHARLDSLTAQFTQSYRSAGVGHEVVERGRIFLKKPGRMRWDYRRPDKKVFIISEDGETLAYVPADRSAVRSNVAPDAPHVRLLRGDGSLSDDFTVRAVRLRVPATEGAQHLKLLPKRPIETIDSVYLEIDPRSALVRRVLVVDELGNESDVVFDRMKLNAPVREATFSLELPAGVEVRDLTVSGGS